MDIRKFPGTFAGPAGMRLAVSVAESAGPKAPILFRGDLGDSVQGARKLGYEGVEVHVADIWEFDAVKFRDQCEEAGMAVAALVSGQLNVRKGLSLCHEDPVNVAKAVEGLNLFVDAAKVLTTGVVIGWVRGKVGDDPARRLEMQAGNLRLVAKRAGDLGVPLYLEGINRYELDSLNNARDIVDFIRRFDLPSTYAHLDTFHMSIEEHSIEKAIREAGSLLGYFHVAENTRWFPGHDRLDFDAVFRALEEIGYDGFVDVECLPYPTPHEAARRAAEFLRHRYFYDKG